MPDMTTAERIYRDFNSVDKFQLPVKYDDVRDFIRPLDLMAFQGRGTFSDAIRTVQHFQDSSNPYNSMTHVGSAIETMLRNNLRKMFVEATTLTNIRDAVTKKLFKGVQVHFISDRLHAYDGHVYWCPLRCTSTPTEQAIDAVMKWATEKHHEGTEYDTVQAMRAGLRFWQSHCKGKEDMDKLFCSELSTKCEQLAGILSADWNPSRVLPAWLVEREVHAAPVRLLV